MLTRLPHAFRHFLLAHAAAALAMGIQIVILAWLAVDVLALPAAQVGWVQAANLLPSLAIILLAGALADRWHPSVLLMVSSSAIAVAHALAAVALDKGLLTFPGLMAYAAVLGAGNAFIQPAREKLLVAVGDGLLQHTLSRASVFQFSAQGLGVLLASSAHVVGAATLMFFQAALTLTGVLLYRNLRREPVAAEETVNATVTSAIGAGVTTAWRHPVLRQQILLVGFNGFMHMGIFVMLLPWLARNIYQLNSFGYGALQFVFLSGTIVAHTVLLKRRKVEHPGRGVLFCLLYAGAVMLAIAAGPTLIGLYLLTAAWGAIAGSSAGLSRVVLQSTCAHAERGRLMSLYQLALFGMAPLGALAAGYGVSHWGHEAVLEIAGGSSAVLFGLFLFSRALWVVQQDD